MQDPRVPSSLTFPVSHFSEGRLLLFGNAGGAIYDEAADTWLATETIAGVSAPGYFLSGDRYVDFGHAPRLLDLTSGGWTDLPSDAAGLEVDPNQSYGWTIQVWSGRTFFRWGLFIEPSCTNAIDSDCQPPLSIVSGAMYTLSD
jgi:hypothetical protein